MTKTWIDERVEYLKKLTKPTEQQRLLIAFYDDREHLSSIQKKKFDVLVTAEKAIVKADTARAAFRTLDETEKKQSRKERNHELFKAAGLLSLADLLDKETGQPRDAGALLGGLLALSEQLKDPAKAAKYKEAGDVILNKINSENKAKAAAKAAARADRAKREAATTSE